MPAGIDVGSYDISCANWNDEHANKLDRASLPEIVKKSYRDKRKKHMKRAWKLQELTKDDEMVSKRDEEAHQRDLEAFMQDLEEDKELRSTVNLYKDSTFVPRPDPETEDEELAVGVDEMLDEFAALDMAEGADAEDQDGAGPAPQ